MPELKIDIENLEFALNHLKKFKNSSIFPHPFEYKYINQETLEWMSKQSTTSWHPAPSVKILSPKVKGNKISGFREAIQMEAIDTLFYTALTIQAGNDLEKSRIAVSENTIFSYRFKKDEASFAIFDPEINYSTYLERAKELSNEYNYVIHADIANFFPSLYIHDIEKSISDAMGEDYEKAFGLFLKMINCLRTVGGLPVSTDASRFLSNIVLNDVDKLLLSKNISFCRFADDFKLFTQSREEAYQVLYTLSEILSSVLSLSIQTGKTSIQSSEIFLQQFTNNNQDSGLKSKVRSLRDIFEESEIRHSFFNAFYEDAYEEKNLKMSDEEIAEVHKKALEEIEALDFQTSVNEAFSAEVFDYESLKGLLIQFSSIKYLPVFDVLVENFDKGFPITDSIMKYLIGLIKNKALTEEEAIKIKDKIIDLLSGNAYVARIPFYKLWILVALDSFSDFLEEKDARVLINMSESEKSLIKSSIIRILGKIKCKHWFRSKIGEFSSFNNCEKIAFLEGYKSCNFSENESRPFEKSIRGLMDARNKYALEIIK